MAVGELREGGGLTLTRLMAAVEGAGCGEREDAWCGVAYGAHPRTVLRAGARGLWLADARATPAATLAVYQVRRPLLLHLNALTHSLPEESERGWSCVASADDGPGHTQAPIGESREPPAVLV